MNLYEPRRARPTDERRFKVYRYGEPMIALRRAAGAALDLGVEVVDERPYEIAPHRRPRSASTTSGCAPGARRAPRSGRASWRTPSPRPGAGEAESGRLQRLVLRGGLTWRQVVVLRAYAKYLRQTGTTFSQEYIEHALRRLRRDRPAAGASSSRPGSPRTPLRPATPAATRDGRGSHRAWSRRSTPRWTTWPASTRTGSCASFLDADPGDPADQLLPARRGRAARSRTWRSSSTRRRCRTCPQPRPMYEIFVYSPAVRGRAPALRRRSRAAACAGRDRREDFRTEVLGLVKAQMVKNAVIVPAGAKGGFVAKQLPDPRRPGGVAGRGRRLLPDVHLAACSTSPTTSSTAARSCRRADVVRHDGDDPYLVVAADKGTATFSDIANEIAGDVRLLARRRVRLRRLGRLRPQGDGHHRPRRVGVGQAALPRAGP